MSQLAKYMIGLMLFSMIIIGTTMFLRGFSDNYNIEVEPGWEDSYNFIDNMTTIGDDMTGILESKETNWAVSGLRMGYSVLKGALQLPQFMGDIFGKIGTRLGITKETKWVTNYIIIIITMLIIFIITAGLIRWYI